MLEKKSKLFKELPKSFHNPYEYYAEYILIPGGRYRYQNKTKKKVSKLYFAKYPVTNKRYRRFIRYLEDNERELLEILPKGEFDKRITEFVSGTEFYGKYPLDRPPKLNLPVTLRSRHDTDKRFKGENQPVVGVSWLAARTYCFWLSLLEVAGENLSYDKAACLYRLPYDVEWEWAAGGGKRKYPWSPEKGQPTAKLANYGWNARGTTPVGRYPEGATPEGLMDMAGNVWEWMEDRRDELYGWYSFRGGSWDLNEYYLCCFAQGFHLPVYLNPYNGFRVVRSQ